MHSCPDCVAHGIHAQRRLLSTREEAPLYPKKCSHPNDLFELYAVFDTSDDNYNRTRSLEPR